MDYIVSMIDGIKLVEFESGMVRLETSTVHGFRPPVTLVGVTPGLLNALEQLNGAGQSLQVLIGQVLRTDGTTGIARFHQFVQKLTQLAMLTRTIQLGDQRIATIRPLSTYHRFDENRVAPETQYVLSRFAWMRNSDGRILLECPLGHAEIEFSSSLAQLAVHELANPNDVAGLAAKTHIDADAVTKIMNFLANAEALVPVTGDNNPEANDPVTTQWDFHDMVFHSRSRMGRHANPYGGTWHFKGRFPPLAVIKPDMSDTIVPLDKPDMELLKRDDPPFTDVLERRESIRTQGDPPISKQQLGEFLYRVARIKRLSSDGDVSFRPHPAGGAIHELEIYPIVDQCDGLSQGLYHYNPLDHHLSQISGPNPKVNLLLRLAGQTATLDHYPQVLFVIAARFQRMQMKYQSVTYSVILKNVGALYQTMYLVATAMGLAPCALGGGHADLFVEAAGLDYYAESSVGEFVLGSQG